MLYSAAAAAAAAHRATIRPVRERTFRHLPMPMKTYEVGDVSYARTALGRTQHTGSSKLSPTSETAK